MEINYQDNTSQSSSESLQKAFDPQSDDILYMDMSGSSNKSQRSSPWTTDNVDLYMNSPKLSPRSKWFLSTPETCRTRSRSPVAKQLWKMATDDNLAPPEGCTNMDVAQEAKESSLENSVTDIFLHVPNVIITDSDTEQPIEQVSMDIRDISVEKQTELMARSVPGTVDQEGSIYSLEASKGSINCDITKNAPLLIESIYSGSPTLPRCSAIAVEENPKSIDCNSQTADQSPVTRECSHKTDGDSSPIYLSPHCQSCSKMLHSTPDEIVSKSDKDTGADSENLKCDLNNTYMSITSIDLGASPATTKPPELPKRNSEHAIQLEKITQKMCRCNEVRKTPKRALHLEDVVEGTGSKVYCIKDIVESVDELIGAFCEDDSMFSVPSRKPILHNLLRKPSFTLRDNYLLRRPKISLQQKRAGNKTNSRDSGFESDEYKNRQSGKINTNDGRCHLRDCSNCQEMDGNVNTENDGGTLDCYSYAYSKCLPVEAYNSTNLKQQQQPIINPARRPSNDSVPLPLNSQEVQSKRKNLLAHLPSVGPKLHELSDGTLYQSIVNKATKLKHKAPFTFGRHSFRAHKLSGSNFGIYSDPPGVNNINNKRVTRSSSDQQTDKHPSEVRTPLKDLNNNGQNRQNLYVPVPGRKAERSASLLKASSQQGFKTPRETAC